MKKEKRILRQNVGIDISKHKFDACLATIDEDGNVKFVETKQFKNSKKGFKEFIAWVEKTKIPHLPVSFTMEATGVYHEGLAYFLHDNNKRLSIILPNKVKKYIQSLNIKSKTDKIDAKALARIGLERSLPVWKLSSKVYRKLRKLTRARARLVEFRKKLKGHLEAELHCGEPMPYIIQSIKQHIEYINQKIEELEEKIKQLVAQDKYVSKKIEKITTIPGVGFITAVTIISETQGFDNFNNLRQVWSYAGYDVVHKESGKYKGRTHISKKGNVHIRKILYCASMTIIKYSETYKNFYEKLKSRKGSGMLALVAVQRKLLGLIYTLWKNDTEFIDNYEQIKAQKTMTSLDIESTSKSENTEQNSDTPKLINIGGIHNRKSRRKRSGEDTYVLTTQDEQLIKSCSPSAPANLIKIRQKK